MASAETLLGIGVMRLLVTAEQNGSFRCEICDLDFDSMDRLTDHNVQQPPGTLPQAPAVEIESRGRMR